MIGQRYYCDPCRLANLRATKRRRLGLNPENRGACETCRTGRREAYAALTPQQRRAHQLNREPEKQCVADIFSVVLGSMDPSWIKAGGRAEVVKILLADGGRTHREIAELSGTSEQTVSRRARAAREGREHPMPAAFCQPCRDRRTQKDHGLVDTAPLCADCRRKRLEKAASGPSEVRVAEEKCTSRFIADELAIEMVADGLIHGSRVYPIERREAAKIMVLRGRVDNGSIAKQCGIHIRSVDRLSTALRQGVLEMRAN